MSTAVPPQTVVGQMATTLWRIFFVIAVVVVATSTHWPRLAFTEPQDPVDKFLHASAFGVLAAMVWQTRWVKSRWTCLAIMALWSAIDESTQAIPGINRTATWDDWCADLLGIAIAGMMMAAVRPVPGVLAHLLDSQRRILGYMLLDRPMNWLHLATASVLGVGIGSTGGFLIDARFYIVSRPAQAVVLGGIFGGLAAFYMMREFGVRTLQRRVAKAAPCLTCGELTEGAAACPRCRAPVHPLSWTPFSLLTGREEFTLCAPLVFGGLAFVIVVAAVAIWGATYLSVTNELFRPVGKWHQSLPTDLQRMVDITFFAAVGTFTYRRCRRKLARALDRSGSRCLACGHDLRGVPHNVAAGVCAECGEPFVRASAVA